jgi:transposase
MDWPPYSLDINPIENLWKLLKAKIIELHLELITIKDNDASKRYLIRAAKEAWKLLEDDLLDALTLGMQKRIDALKQSCRRVVYEILEC